jgi:hypothetical protein
MPENFATFLSTHQWIFILAAIWIIPWKGVALWRAARNLNVAWFVILLIINTLGILEIVYIFAFSKKKGSIQLIEKKETQVPEKKIVDIKVEAKTDLDEKSKKS